MVEKVMSVPVDPHELLQDIDMMLGEEGSLKSPAEVDRIVGLMQDAKKMVSRCIYLNILKTTTESEILLKFIEVGGWAILNSWLQEAKKEDNHPLLIEVLKVYQIMPVSVDLLKQNSCAKTIKQITRIEDDSLKSLANTIVETWMQTIKGRSDSDKTKSKSKKRHHHRTPSEDKDKNIQPARPVSPDSASNDSSSIDRTSVDSYDTQVPDSSAKSTAVSKPKTVKIIQSKFRSTGNCAGVLFYGSQWISPDTRVIVS